MKKLFENDTFFAITTVIAAFGLMFFGGYYLTQDAALQTNGITYMCCAVFIITLFISYKKHAKNVMKGMMGAMLASMVISAFVMSVSMETAAEKACIPIYIFIALGLFINHFMINESRNPSPSKVRFNQVLVLLLAVDLIVLSIASISGQTGGGVVACIINIFAYPCMAASIVCVESRLDAYRIDREAAGWTAEKGYPEGYQRKK